MATKQFNTRLEESTIDALKRESQARSVPVARLVREGIDHVLSNKAAASADA